MPTIVLILTRSFIDHFGSFLVCCDNTPLLWRMLRPLTYAKSLDPCRQVLADVSLHGPNFPHPYPCQHLPCTSPFVPNIPSTVILNFLWPMSLSCGWPMSHMLPTYLSIAEVYIVPSLCPLPMTRSLPIFSMPEPFPARMPWPVHMYTIIYYTIPL